MRPGNPNLRGQPNMAFIDAFQDELLRWNTSMNLVSRRDTAKISCGLVAQCWGAFELLVSWCEERAALPRGEKFCYVDLGSGAGFPGIIWNQRFFQAGFMPETFLVEPREKRGWFLKRVGSLAGAAPFRVLRGRWGELGDDFVPPAASESAVVSLKALHLNDFTVLEGLIGGKGEGIGFSGGFSEVVIIRFYPPQQKIDSRLEVDLGFPGIGNTVHCSGRKFVFRGCDILGPVGGLLPASLVVTRYKCTGLG